MSIVQTQTTQFKSDLLNGLVNFTTTSPYTYKVALYTALANLSNTTATYAGTANEVVATGYTAGGNPITISANPGIDLTNNIAFPFFNNVIWAGSVITARGALIYNATTGNSVAVLNFGNDVTMSNFTITWPAATSTTAVITIS
jgi:hypothetical protein